MMKSSTSLLYEYCQNKDTSISISDIEFKYEQGNNGLYNCKVFIKKDRMNTMIFDQHLECKSKKMAKNEISDYVYHELIKMDNNNKESIENKKNSVAKLNEYLQDKCTNINPSDVDYYYETDIEGLFNCKIIIKKKKVFDQHLKCKSKKESKQIISEYVYNYMTGNIKPSFKLSEEVLEKLKLQKIKEEDLCIEIQDFEYDKYICLINFKNFNKTFMIMEPKTPEEINKE